MLPVKRSKQTFLLEKIHETRVATQIRQQHDAQEEVTIKYELVPAEPEDKQEDHILVATGDSLHTELKMTCSDSEDSTGASTDSRCSVSQTSYTNSYPASTETTHMAKAKSAIPSKEPSISNVLNILTTVSENIKKMQEKTETIQKEVASISNRLARVERKVGISLATMEQVKDVVITADACFGTDANTAAAFSFEPISSEEELMECDSKLGNDEEYYANVIKWLRLQINVPDPDNRLHLALDLIFERTFLPLCSWTGNGRPAPKIALCGRTNVLKLFADIGSNQYFRVNELFVQKFFLKKLPHAKNRINLIQGRATSCRKRKLT